MRAQVIHSFGEPDVFRLEERPTPSPRACEVLIRVAASSVNPVDWKVRRFGPGIAPPLPAVLGCDLSGMIEAVGSDVAMFKSGDAVYGCAGGLAGVSSGAYAEFMACDARLLAAAPRSIPLADAAALPLVAITAWEGLVEKARLQTGERVLVHGGAGGVGHVAIQLAKAMGAVVHATVSTPDKAAIAKALGADETIAYRDEPIAAYVARLTGGTGYDVVFDATGGDDLAMSAEGARLNGRIVTIVSMYSADLTPLHLKGLSLHVVFMPIPMLHDVERERHGRILGEIASMVDAGAIRPLIDPERFSLERLADAHRKQETGASVGKIIVEVADIA